MGRTAAFFDLDGTICSGQSWKGLPEYCLAKEVNLRIYYSFFFSHIGLWLLSKAKIISKETLISSWVKDMAILTKNLPRDKAMDMFNWVAQRHVLDRLREQVINELRWHQAQGHLVILVSGTFKEILDIVGQNLEIKHIVGTKLKMMRGHYTGKLEGDFCFGEEKGKMLYEYLSSLGEEVDMASSYSYTDRFYDLPMLEMTGNPVAVYPDDRLRAYVETKGWRIIEGI